MAYDVVNGDLLWSGGEQKLSYSSPVFAELAGYPQIVVFNANGVAGHDVETGAVLWESNFNDQNVHVAAPLVIDTQRILVSAGYGVGSELFQVGLKSEGSWEVKQEWVSRRMKAKFANLVLRDGHIYGPDDGIMACISAAAGDLKWKDGRYGHGQMILTGDLLLMMAEDGRVVLIEASPEQLNELGSVRVFTDKTWNPPALSGNHLLLRNDREAVCLRLALTDPR
jgi:outer membrane protein assembly factor BamB